MLISWIYKSAYSDPDTSKMVKNEIDPSIHATVFRIQCRSEWIDHLLDCLIDCHHPISLVAPKKRFLRLIFKMSILSWNLTKMTIPNEILWLNDLYVNLGNWFESNAQLPVERMAVSNTNPNRSSIPLRAETIE